MPLLTYSSKQHKINALRDAPLKHDALAFLKAKIVQQQSTITELTEIASKQQSTINKLTMINSRQLSTITKLTATAIQQLTGPVQQQISISTSKQDQTSKKCTKRYQCPLPKCSSTFARSSNLNDHLKKKHRAMYDKLNPSNGPHCNAQVKRSILHHLSDQHPELLPGFTAEVLNVDFPAIKKLPQGFELFGVEYLKTLKFPPAKANRVHHSLSCMNPQLPSKPHEILDHAPSGRWQTHKRYTAQREHAGRSWQRIKL
ncbi:hypothetical protein D8B26_007042 [Coccidioides posadasii str. Silveira]|uniref:Predicted protein n=1 Tax=Coccidioides posadasii (strain RMSCC 757 / Silveira) TaxID=443226 RepID=E9DGZ8_COCPS|nr:predicted protein [Coccidioides posadasii str. Silveira]QVM12413.1 hypothetical protein D8B26_007042 [Coccidioides posadasii str. Silveira]